MVLLRRATDEHPRSAQAAVAYLISALAPTAPPTRQTELIEPFSKRFSKDPHIQALLAIALFEDERFVEAADALKHAHELDAKVTQFVGEQDVKAIEQGRDLTPKIVGAAEALKAGQLETASATLRDALAENPRNLAAAQLLTRAIVNQLNSGRELSVRCAAAGAAEEISALSQEFPDDGGMQAGLAIALHLAGRNAEAEQALQRAEQLGADLDRLTHPADVQEIRDAAEQDRTAHCW